MGSVESIYQHSLFQSNRCFYVLMSWLYDSCYWYYFILSCEALKVKELMPHFCRLPNFRLPVSQKERRTTYHRGLCILCLFEQHPCFPPRWHCLCTPFFSLRLTNRSLMSHGGFLPPLPVFLSPKQHRK